MTGISGLLITIIMLILFGLTCKRHYSCIFLIWVLIYFLIFITPLEYLSKVKFLEIEEEQSIEVSNNGSFSLVSGTTAVTSSEFIVTDLTTVAELEDYLGDQNKGVYLYIKSGSDILYEKNLGLIVKDDIPSKASQLLSTYDTWKETSTLPSEDTIIWLWKIYVKR